MERRLITLVNILETPEHGLVGWRGGLHIAVGAERFRLVTVESRVHQLTEHDPLARPRRTTTVEARQIKAPPNTGALDVREDRRGAPGDEHPLILAGTRYLDALVDKTL